MLYPTKFAPGQSVFVNKTPKESAFAGWIGTVQETRPTELAGLMVSVDFDHKTYGEHKDIMFSENELKADDSGQ